MTQGKEGVPRAYMTNIRCGILRHGKVLGYRLAPNSCPELGLGCRKHVPSEYCRVEKKSPCQVVAHVTCSLPRFQIERGECVGHGKHYNLLRASAADRCADFSVPSHSAAAGGRTFGVCTRRQSRLAKSASNWATESFMTPSRMGGQAKLPCSRRL